jgi:hypothetical protein
MLNIQPPMINAAFLGGMDRYRIANPCDLAIGSSAGYRGF